MPLRTQGFSLIEVLLAVVVLMIAVTLYASLNTQGARTISNANLSTYAADALTATSLQITQGNPLYLHSRSLTPEDLQQLSINDEGRRSALRPALSGTITAQGGSPPRYDITIRGPDFILARTAVAPGGEP